MRYVARPPHPALRPLVRALWYFESRDALPHARERVIPDGGMQLLVNLEEDELRWWEGARFDHAHVSGGAAVSGAYPRAIAIDTREQKRITGVSFAPGGAPAFVHVPADELQAKQPAFDEVSFGDPSLRERLALAPTPEATLDVWEAVLLTRLRGGLDPCVGFALSALERGDAVSRVADELGWSGKRLRRRFRAKVGLFPKRYAKLRRVQRTLPAMATASRSFARIAHECGFHDQAHLIRDFRDVAGTTPGAYAARADGDLNHLVLD